MIRAVVIKVTLFGWALHSTVCSLTELSLRTVPKLWKWIPSIQVRYNQTPSVYEKMCKVITVVECTKFFIADLLWPMSCSCVHSVVSRFQVNWSHLDPDSYECRILSSFARFRRAFPGHLLYFDIALLYHSWVANHPSLCSSIVLSFIFSVNKWHFSQGQFHFIWVVLSLFTFYMCFPDDISHFLNPRDNNPMFWYLFFYKEAAVFVSSSVKETDGMGQCNCWNTDHTIINELLIDV